MNPPRHAVRSSSLGFTLVELMVTVGVAIIITGLLVTNFSRSRVDLNRALLVVTDGIRETQSLALTGATVRGQAVCGYGIHFEEDGFLIFAEPKSGGCDAQNRVYDTGDELIRSATLGNAALEVVLPADDIFFEPPDPTTYLNGAYVPTAQTIILIRRSGADCSQEVFDEPSSDCRSVLVTGAGRIQAR